ncbi:hypothetical protein GH714_041390 [Hevea brasiliensis]|uniref:Retrotransposon gag domain-containing protein n=1 Tax=Hevea brasiliensis TaxID=3981 RepID=A0A6A6N061_HEVBR|nr:hypothetical protein GH714_041390 [Hevea brasiliensis]
MAKLANQLDALERRVDDALAVIDNCPTYEALIEELEVVRLSLEQRNKHVEVLEEKIEQLVAVVAKLIGGGRNFIFDMELYFTATKNDFDAGKLKMVPMYLANDANLWWRTKVEQSISGQCSIVTWDDFKKALKAQFYPENVAYNARCKLAELQHIGSIREYVRSFTALMLDIKDMSEADRLFKFQKGLKPWARNELVRRGVKELSTALAVAESLDDYTSNASKRKFNSLPGSDNCLNKWGRNSSGGVDRSNSTFGVMGALRILGALEKQKPRATTEKGLMYVDLLINGKNAKALVDTGATDNFVADTLVTRFKLMVQADARKDKSSEFSSLEHRRSCSWGVLSDGTLERQNRFYSDSP